MEKIIIIGAGVSGLSCLNALLDKNISPLLLEAGTIGTPKICGEFIAPDAVKQLLHWEIENIIPIHNVFFHCKQSHLDISFPNYGGAIARADAELQLMRRAQKLGARIRENSAIEKIIPPTNVSPFIIQLSSGEEIFCKHVIFATGRFAQNKNPSFPYIGIKTHVNHVVKPNTLLMFSDKNAYFGLIPISDSMSNFACLVKASEVRKYSSNEEYLFNLIKQNQHLEFMTKQKINLLTGHAPEFGFRKIPSWSNAYWIGDAFISLPPAIGSGFAHGIKSGVLAAEFYAQNNHHNYFAFTKRLTKPKHIYGGLLHKVLLNPMFGSLLFPAAKKFPLVSRWVLERLGFCY